MFSVRAVVVWSQSGYKSQERTMLFFMLTLVIYMALLPCTLLTVKYINHIRAARRSFGEAEKQNAETYNNFRFASYRIII